VGPNATILPDVVIGNNCYIKSGAVVGSEGFELKRTTQGILNVLHDGKVIIGNDVKVGANSAIHKGFSFRHTVIADDVKIDDLVYIAHAVHIGKGCFLIGNSMISGSTTLKENIWVGPGVTVSSGLIIESNAFLTIGSVVTRNVGKDEKVTGNFAIPHDKFLEDLKRK
jgi:UDP-3-O-[3-hydroxymyristoyl] glucosamine N-acyltransferase